jgi:hypothetical protein
MTVLCSSGSLARATLRWGGPAVRLTDSRLSRQYTPSFDLRMVTNV